MQREFEEIRFFDGVTAGASHHALITAAHDLKAPLSLIKFYAQHMQSADISAEERQKYTRRIALSAEQLLKMTTGLLEAYRFGEQTLPLEPVNATIACEEVLHELAPYANELGQALRYQAAQRQCVVVAHRQLLHNVLFNIAYNALKHTPEKTIVTVKLLRSHNLSRIHVTDNGPGFKQADLQRFGGSTTPLLQPLRSHSGTGFGLSIAKQLTHIMGGELKLLASQRGGHCLVMLHSSRQLALPL
ncbi:MAG TPA: HAMP domain-containing sensor histidine kinase [Candidatus Saccharimonadales bacterium]